MKTTTIQLGDMMFELGTLPYRQAKPWRKRLIDEIKPMFDRFAETQTAEFRQPSDLLALWPIIEMIAYDGIEAMLELMYAYDPALEAARNEIEETATDSQIVDAFKELVALIDPFGVIALIVRRSGLGRMTTSPKLQYQNGASVSSVPTD